MIAFLTGTRADFGKLKPLILATQEADFEVVVFATGMHLQPKYGLTLREVERLGVPVHPFVNYREGDTPSQILAKTVNGISDFLSTIEIELLVLHGDRIEALAGAIAGAMGGVRVAHVEGGELSGTLDESLRHAITKLSHVHLVANEAAAKRIRRLGEETERIFVLGSPEVDVMLHGELPEIEEVRKHYGLPQGEFCIFVAHPVTTEEPAMLIEAIRQTLQALLEIDNVFVIALMPNNDLGSNDILKCYEEFKGNDKFKLLPSMRFEYYLAALREARAIIGNSSSGVREAPVFGVPSLNIGSRQHRRASSPSIFELSTPITQDVRLLLSRVLEAKVAHGSLEFGDGSAGQKFATLLLEGSLTSIPLQKEFED